MRHSRNGYWNIVQSIARAIIGRVVLLFPHDVGYNGQPSESINLAALDV